jgi:lipopolysaccharide biosynthesis protein
MRDFYRQYDRNVGRGPHYLGAEHLPADPPASWPVKPIAFYLPQFHAIPENSAWHGPGFTEWTNVTKAVPRYEGHLQPRLPADLGFYDLSNPDTLRRQAELVRRGGLYGLCIHDYWFGGRKVLETPLELLLANPDIDLRFCLNWANENWSRRWDGSEHDILLEQRYDPDDREGYARSVLPAVRDPRYIRLGGRPLLLIYRPSLLPEPRATFDSWRALFRREGLGDPYLAMVQSFEDYDPRPYGLDGAVGFPPHNAGTWDEALNERDRVRWLDVDMLGHVRPYPDLAARMLRNDPDEFRLFPGVCPSWDNEARKPRRGTSFYDATPAAFEEWLFQAATRAADAPADERLVFINAWNEWAEGAILEPDRHNGHANLVAIRRVLDRLARGERAEVGAPVARGPGEVRPSKTNLYRNKITRRARRLLNR